MKLSEQLQQDSDCGDFGRALEGYAERARRMEARIEELEKPKKMIKSYMGYSEGDRVKFIDGFELDGGIIVEICLGFDDPIFHLDSLDGRQLNPMDFGVFKQIVDRVLTDKDVIVEGEAG